MFYVYIIYSRKVDRYYIGITSNTDKRITEHNSGVSKFTSMANDWIMKYRESYSTRFHAHQRELAIKKKKSRKYIEWLIMQN